MPTFELSANGKTFEIDAPDQGAALSAFQKMQGSQPETPSTGEDVGKSLGVGVAKGAIGLAGLPVDAANLLVKGSQAAGNWIGGKLGFEPGPEVQPGKIDQFGSQGIQKNIEGVTGEFYKPKTTLGKYAETVGEFAPGMIGPGGLVRKAITQVALPGIGSEAAGQVAEKYAPSLEPYARLGGALAGGVLPSALSRVVTPLPASQGRNAMVDTLRAEGVTDLTAGQTTGRKGLQYFESERGGSVPANAMERQGEQFTAAALRRVGEDANRATPEVIDRAFNRIGAQFDGLAARNTATADRQMMHDITNVVDEYNSLVAPSQRAPIMRDIIQGPLTTGGQIAGDVYQSTVSRLERAARGTKDPELAHALRGLRRALDDTMERSIARTNPADLGGWREARNQYRNMLVLEKAVTGAGENAALGLISPSALRNAVVAQSRRGYGRGQGDFADLARAGEAIMKPLPNSGTAPRMSAQNFGTGVSSVTGAVLGGLAGGGSLVGGGVGAAAGAMLPHILGRVAVSAPGRAYLGNQLLANQQQNMNPTRAAAIAALLYGGQRLSGN